MGRAGGSVNPFAQPAPKPKIVDLISLITAKQKGTYRNLSRSLKRLHGVHANLNYYGNEWGWALTYRHGDATLCTLHFLPSKLEVTVTVSRTLADWSEGPNHLSRATKRSLQSVRWKSHGTLLRMPLGSPHRARDLVKMVRFKVQSRPGPARRRPSPPERIAGARARPIPSP